MSLHANDALLKLPMIDNTLLTITTDKTATSRSAIHTASSSISANNSNSNSRAVTTTRSPKKDRHDSSSYSNENSNMLSLAPDIAAGVPVLELIRKLEEEKILNREDRKVLNEALYEPSRRDKIVLAIRDVELGGNQRFAVLRLKSLIHQNSAGALSSKDVNSNYHRSNSSNGNNFYNLPDINYTSNDIVSQQQQQRQQDQQQQEEQQDPHSATIISNTMDDGNPAFNSNAYILNTSDNDDGKENNFASNGQTISTFLVEERFTSSPIAAPRPRFSSNILYSNNYGSGKISIGNNTSQGRKNKVDDDVSLAASTAAEITATISSVVGIAPLYHTPDNYNVCNKIAKRLYDFLKAYKPSMGTRKFAVVVGTGSCNPLTRMHLRSYFLAKQYLEQSAGYVVLGSLISAAHGSTVRERYRFHSSEIIPSPHRLAIAQLQVRDSKWLTIDPWEITRRRAMDYMALLEHTAEILKDHFDGLDFKILYICKGNMLPKLSPSALKAQNFGVMCVSRPPESEVLANTLKASWNGVLHIVEDRAILDNSMDVVTSRHVRDRIRTNDNIAQFIGGPVQSYIRLHKIGEKMNGSELWLDEDKKLPAIVSRPFKFQFEHALKDNGSVYTDGVGATDSRSRASLDVDNYLKGGNSINQNDGDDASVISEVTVSSMKGGRKLRTRVANIV